MVLKKVSALAFHSKENKKERGSLKDPLFVFNKQHLINIVYSTFVIIIGSSSFIILFQLV